MDVLGDAVDRTRRDQLSDAPAVRHAGADRAVDYRRLCTTAWKTANFLHNEGVRGGMAVAIADDPAPEAIWAFVAAGILGARVEFLDETRRVDSRAIVVPIARADTFVLDPGTRIVAYGGAPADPSIAHFERDVWSENPTEPPDVVSPDDDLLRTGGRTYSQADVLEAAREVGARYDLDAGTSVAVRAPFTEPRTVFAGLVAPLLAGGTVLLPGEDDVGDVAVGWGPVPESRVVEV